MIGKARTCWRGPCQPSLPAAVAQFDQTRNIAASLEARTETNWKGKQTIKASLEAKTETNNFYLFKFINIYVNSHWQHIQYVSTSFATESKDFLNLSNVESYIFSLIYRVSSSKSQWFSNFNHLQPADVFLRDLWVSLVVWVNVTPVIRAVLFPIKKWVYQTYDQSEGGVSHSLFAIPGSKNNVRTFGNSYKVFAHTLIKRALISLVT